MTATDLTLALALLLPVLLAVLMERTGPAEPKR